MDDSVSPSISPPQPQTQPMASSISAILDDPASASSLFDWSDFLDFNLDEPFDSVSFDAYEQVQEAKPISPPSDSEALLPLGEEPGRVRKRDPRLVCSNFLAGRVPCACPELDEKLEQEDEMVLGGQGKKRARTVRIPTGSNARCQVPGCEVDISELKGYHKRHRVCLRCANATSVVLDGQSKRYCQQCGK